jgi:DNA-binding CsgD family transcriptional regulator
MADRLTVTSRDLRRLLDVADASRLTPGADGFPAGTLEAIRDLVPCTAVAYNAVDPRNDQFLFGQCVGERDPFVVDADTLTDVDRRMREETVACTYTYSTPEHTAVYRATDFYPSHRSYFAGAYGDWLTVTGGRFDVLIPLSQTPGCDHRLVLFRDEGRDFSERDLMLLSLLRPHLVELDEQAHPTPPPLPLSARQLEVLRLVAEGLTNRQIARQLGLSEGTVRTHLMNVYTALGVQSRAAAVAALLADAG